MARLGDFLKATGSVLRDLINEAGKSPQSWYILGQNDAKFGAPRQTPQLYGRGLHPDLIKAYDAGYDNYRKDANHSR